VAKKDFEHGFFGDAASRAYYAVFHAISAVLATKGLTFSSHTQTIGAFNRECVKNGIFPADTNRIIQRIFADRHTADYDIEIAVDEPMSKQDISDAESVLNLCKEYIEKYVKKSE